MKKLVFAALVGLATSGGAAFPAAAHAEPIDLGAAISTCVQTYLAGDVSDVVTLNACIDDAIRVALAEGTTDGATINTEILGTATDATVNTDVVGSVSG
jgi:hypothetical protein